MHPLVCNPRPGAVVRPRAKKKIQVSNNPPNQGVVDTQGRSAGIGRGRGTSKLKRTPRDQSRAVHFQRTRPSGRGSITRVNSASFLAEECVLCRSGVTMWGVGEQGQSEGPDRPATGTPSSPCAISPGGPQKKRGGTSVVAGRSQPHAFSFARQYPMNWSSKPKTRKRRMGCPATREGGSGLRCRARWGRSGLWSASLNGWTDGSQQQAPTHIVASWSLAIDIEN